MGKEVSFSQFCEDFYTQSRLECEATVIEQKNLEDCTSQELQTKLAYHMWKDGADWPVVCEMWQDKTLGRDYIISTLKECFGEIYA